MTPHAADPNQPELFEPEPEPPRVCNQCGKGDEGCQCCFEEEIDED